MTKPTEKNKKSATHPAAQAASGMSGVVSWIVAAASTLGVGAVLYFGNLAMQGLHSRTLYHQLATHVEVAQKIESVTSHELYAPLLEPKRSAINELVNTENLILEGQYGRARTNIKGLTGLKNANAKNLLIELDAAAGVEDQRKELDRNSASVEQEKSRNRQKYRDILQALAGLLGQRVSVHQVMEKIGENPMSFPLYERGVLSALPVIEGIPDNLANQDQLLGLLSAQRRKELPVEMAQRKTSVARELDTMRNNSFALIEQLADTQNKLQALADTKTGLAFAEQTHQKKIQLYIRATIKDLVTPTLTPAQLTAYSTWCKLVPSTCPGQVQS